MTLSKQNTIKLTIILLVLISVTLRILSIPSWNWDMTEHNVPWYMTLRNDGIPAALGTRFADYAPPYTYFLALVTFTYGLIQPLYAIKLIPIFFDVLGAVFVYKLVKLKYEQGLLPALAAAIYFTAPSIILNSAHWGQVDSLYTFFLLVSLYLIIKEKPLASIISLGLAFSIKAQGAFLVPFMCVMVLRKKMPWWYLVLVPLIYMIAAMPVVLLGRPFMEVMLIYKAQALTYPELAMNAATIYTLFPHEWYPAFLPIALVIAAILVMYWIYATSQNKIKLDYKYLTLIAFISVALVPFVLPKMHDRYFYPADVLSIILAFYYPALWFLPILYQLSSTSAISIFLFGTNATFVIYGFFLNTIALAVALRTQRLAENEKTANPKIPELVSWLGTLFTPVILFGISMNLLLTPAFIRAEYNMPYIPADSYGFSKSERFHWASLTMDYLTSTKQDQYLAKQISENGSPVFTEQEIPIIDGIQAAIHKTAALWELLLAACFVLAMLAWAGDWLPEFRRGIKRGAWLTVGLAVILGIASFFLTGFNVNADLQSSDTFLRLFPIRIWQDFFLFTSLLLIGIGALLGFGLTKIEGKPKSS
jgi:Gpi18-like mannosyltransferase